MEKRVKLLSVVGARSQFVKLAPLDRAVHGHNVGHARSAIEHVIVHTGQHYDANMSDVFFDELSLPQLRHHLGIGSGSHGAQTGLLKEFTGIDDPYEAPTHAEVVIDTSQLSAEDGAIRILNYIEKSGYVVQM